MGGLKTAALARQETTASGRTLRTIFSTNGTLCVFRALKCAVWSSAR
ncbi:MAG TPA: hypothetical protein VFK85_14490 [Anaeromyxobacteraceae bacterium]|nr:hypothetical protein [Anaeromyxobacteraceae bacterium]